MKKKKAGDGAARQHRPTKGDIQGSNADRSPLRAAGMGGDVKSGTDEDEDLVQQCIEVIRSEQQASVSLLQRRLRLGYTRAARIMDELEVRGIVGPSKGAEPRDILIDLDSKSARTAEPGWSARDIRIAKEGNSEVVNRGNELPRADVDLAHRRELEIEEGDALRQEICRRVGDYRGKATDAAQRVIEVANDAREIGLLIQKAVEALPGKRMTVDFWHQQKAELLDPQGRPITLSNINVFLKLARSEPNEITDLKHALSYRQDCFSVGGFELEGLAPGSGPREEEGESRVEGRGSSPYIKLRENFDRWTRDFQSMRKGLESDPNFGPVAKWDASRRADVMVKLEPLWTELNGLMKELKVTDI